MVRKCKLISLQCGTVLGPAHPYPVKKRLQPYFLKNKALNHSVISHRTNAPGGECLASPKWEKRGIGSHCVTLLLFEEATTKKRLQHDDSNRFFGIIEATVASSPAIRAYCNSPEAQGQKLKRYI